MQSMLAPEFYSPNFREEVRSSNLSTLEYRRLLNEGLRRVGSSWLECEDVPEGTTAEIDLPALNHYRHWKTAMGDHFVSVDSGNWSLLTAEEYEELVHSKMNPELQEKLEKNFILLTEDNIKRYINKIRVKYGFLQEGPTLHIVVVTSNCNLKCIYCQASAPTAVKKDMDIDTARIAVDRIVESPSDSYIIEFQGGEPLLNFNTIKFIIEYSESLAEKLGKRIEYSLISNFTRSVTEEKLRYLIKHNVSICLSLDGPRELHEANRGSGYPNAFDDLLSSLELYKKTWKAMRDEPVSLAALMTTTRRSLYEYKAIIDQYLELGFKKLSLRPLTPLGTACENSEEISYSALEFIEFWKQSIEYMIQLRQDGVDIVDFYLELALTKLFGNESGYMDLRSPCGASFGQITYDHDGQVYSCDEGRMIGTSHFKVGQADAGSLDTILRSKQAAVIADYSIVEQYYCDYCAFKPYCGVCPVLHQKQKNRMNMNVLESDHCKMMYEMYSFILEKYIYDAEVRDVFNDVLMKVQWQKI